MKREFIRNTPIKDAVIVRCEVRPDFRGANTEGFNKELYDIEPFKSINFIVDSFSYSKKGVLRGFHGDKRNWKIIQCLHGLIQFKAIDLREDSETYGALFEMKLASVSPTQVLLPPGIVNAHQCLSDNCIFFYKLSHDYTPQDEQLSLKWNDPRFKLNWEIPNPILSDRDK